MLYLDPIRLTRSSEIKSDSALRSKNNPNLVHDKVFMLLFSLIMLAGIGLKKHLLAIQPYLLGSILET